MSQTNIRVGSGPIWNEAIVFDIKDPTKHLVVKLCDSRNNVLFESIVDLTTREIMDYSMMGQDLMCYQNTETQYGPRLRIRTHYSYSDRARFETLIRELQEDIMENLRAYDEINEYLIDMETPFQFLKQQHQAQAGGDILTNDEIEDIEIEQKGDNQYHQFEKTYEKTVDRVAESIAL